MTRYRTKIALVLGFLPVLCFPAQQERAWKFPQHLRPQMESRLRQFVAAQAEGRWNEVARLLGAYRRDISRYAPYRPAHKACLISQMKTAPMIEFAFEIQESPFSSEILGTPAGRRWWFLVGNAIIRETSGKARRRGSVVAYRDRGTWYFTPAFIDDEAWARAHLTAEEIASDQKDQVELGLPRGCPLSTVDLHVFLDPNRLSQRNVEFRFRNETDKRVIGYAFTIGDDKRRGSISIGTGAPRDRIEPRGVSRKWEQTYTASVYWCERAGRMRIEVEAVDFDDGSTWNARANQSRR